MEYSIIDFHTHPFDGAERNICSYVGDMPMDMQKAKQAALRLGVKKICGSVIELPCRGIGSFDDIKKLNDIALRLEEGLDGFYIPGFHVHPNYVKESIAEIERMAARGVKLMGELVPYIHTWSTYYDKNVAEILEAAAHYKMVVSIHGPDNEQQENQMDELVKAHKDVVIVAAHPNEKHAFLRHLNRMEWSENYYLDLSGTGVFRHGMLRFGIDKMGAERFLFGTDYPICNPAVFIGGVAMDSLITETEKRKILYDNAAKLLGL